MPLTASAAIRKIAYIHTYNICTYIYVFTYNICKYMWIAVARLFLNSFAASPYLCAQRFDFVCMHTSTRFVGVLPFHTHLMVSCHLFLFIFIVVGSY